MSDSRASWLDVNAPVKSGHWEPWSFYFSIVHNSCFPNEGLKKNSHSNTLTRVVQFILRAVRLTFNMVWSYKNMLHHRVEKYIWGKYNISNIAQVWSAAGFSNIKLAAFSSSPSSDLNISCSDILNIPFHSQESTFYIDKQKLPWFHITRCSSAKIINNNKNSQS